MNKPGWYLVSAMLPAYCTKLQVTLHCCHAQHTHCIALPASLKGRVFEIVKLKEPAAFLRLLAFENELPLQPAQVKIEKIAYATAAYWMLHRTWPVLRNMDENLRKRLGLSLTSLLTQLPTSYHLASSLRAHAPEPDYNQWLFRYWRLHRSQHRRMKKRLKQPDVASLTCRVINPTSAEGLKVLAGLNPAAHNSLIILQPPYAKLQPWAEAWFMVAMAEHRQAQLFYSDHDEINEEGIHHSPCFKPAWSPELQQCSHYVGNVLAIKESALAGIIHQLGHIPSSYELALEAGLLCNQAVQHIPAVLWHQTAGTPGANAPELKAHLNRHGICAHVLTDSRGHLRVKHTLPAQLPRVSVIVPTRNMLKVLKPCINSLLNKTRWPNLEVLIVDNQSTDEDALNYLKHIQQDERVKVLEYNQPFNFSAINNFAVAQASGELICLLNNDTEVIHEDWLEEMVSRLLQPHVGAVGARLYFSDGRVQHAGDVVGVGGCAHHLYGVLEADDPGYMNRAVLPQDLSAVTAACLLTPKSVFEKVGGLNEQHLTVAFNDVDYCLRLREAGYRVLYTPYAELYHHESVSRGKEDNPQKLARAQQEVNYMRSRWANMMQQDPFYNPNLNFAKPDFTLSKVPRVNWPW